MELKERFWSKVNLAGENECWIWTAAKADTGYGRFGLKTEGKWRAFYAHRLAYEELVGPIPPKMEIDHVCRVRACVNPAHMEVVTKVENVMRGIAGPARNARKRFCQRGHEFTEENTYRTKRGHRMCRECCRINDRARAQTEARKKYERERWARRNGPAYKARRKELREVKGR